MTPKERALILYKKHTKEYNRYVCKGKMYQTEEWKEITRILTKLYKNENEL